MRKVSLQLAEKAEYNNNFTQYLPKRNLEFDELVGSAMPWYSLQGELQESAFYSQVELVLTIILKMPGISQVRY